LWKSMYCALWCVLTFKLLQSFGFSGYIQTEFFEFKSFQNLELILYALLGVIIGACGALFIKLFSFIIILKNKYKYPILSE
jgi:H+/Cl- antiporter ClcA